METASERHLTAGARSSRGLVPAAAAGAVALVLASAGAACSDTPRAPVAYVACAGNNHVQVIDLGSGRTLRRIYSGAAPWRLVPAPDGGRLFVQHWYAGTTAVIDLADHEIAGVVGARGPGVFTPDGTRFLTFDWPSSTLKTVDARSLATLEQQATEIRQVYDAAADPDGSRLLLTQFDPLARGPHPRYAYVLAYPTGAPAGARPTPSSYRTGLGPVRARPAGGGAFVLTADHETNGLSLINKLGDGRAVPTCAAPRALLLSPDETRLIVACWRGEGYATSRLVSYRADFRARPWPALVQEAEREITGALTAGAFAPSGKQAYVVERSGRRLLELAPATLATLREFETGDEPADVTVLDLPARARRRAASEGRARARLRAALAHVTAPAGTPRASGLAWLETATVGPLAPLAPSVPVPRRLSVFFRPPDALRAESEDGAVHLARGGHALALDAAGRFQVTPRQDLLSAVYALPFVSTDEAVKLLAGDLPGSPFLRGGLAVDAVREVREGADRYLLVGATAAGERVSQLWLDGPTGRPTNLVEQFPVFDAQGHSAQGGDLLETKFYDEAPVGASGVVWPRRLERRVAGGAVQDVRLLDVRPLPAGGDERFDLALLGGAAPAADADAPPTSGASAPFAEWGIHRAPLPPELQVHTLEDGGVLLQYRCPAGCTEWVTRLEALARERDFVVVAPYPFMRARLALTALGHVETLDALDLPRIERFIETYAGKSRHAEAQPAP